MAQPPAARDYVAEPVYEPVDGRVRIGWPDIVPELPDPCVLAIDGPAALEWDTVIGGLRSVLAETGTPVATLDAGTWLRSWDDVRARTETAQLADDPHFATLASGTLADLFASTPAPDRPDHGVLIVYGPGAALAGADRLWYVDSPKRFAEAGMGHGRYRNLGQPAGAVGTLRRLFYVDWPLLDRHRDALVDRIDLWIDAQRPERPVGIDGSCLRRTLGEYSARPFRTRPTFNTTSWGGHWGQTVLGVNREAASTALGYELIAPESGILIGRNAEDAVEVPFQLLVATHPNAVLGDDVAARFGTSFPIRFDYLDTVGGGNLSVHCHPQPDYMRTVFGWPYTQHETYYMMVGGEGRQVFLGLHEDVDLAEFEKRSRLAENGVPLDIEEFVQTFPAEPHQLFLIPAGTPHGSGEGNVVLEISATPYLYSLRFYDWLRKGSDSQPRPIHIDHAFHNLDGERRGAAVGAQLVPKPQLLDSGPGWREFVLGSLPQMFFDVRRLELDASAAVTSRTGGGFHILNVVEGDGVVLTTEDGRVHPLHYAETLVVPAAVGAYRLTAGRTEARVVKALVR